MYQWINIVEGMRCEPADEWLLDYCRPAAWLTDEQILARNPHTHMLANEGRTQRRAGTHENPSNEKRNQPPLPTSK
jgi:hypothetical protein